MYLKPTKCTLFSLEHILPPVRLLTFYLFIFSGHAAQRGLWPPVAATQRGLWPPCSRGFVITHNDAPQSVGLIWTSD
jgi:hypothetical protein